MAVWLVHGTSTSDPDRRAYIIGAHSSREAAIAQRDNVAAVYAAHVVEVAVDNPQPPILIGRLAAISPDPCTSDRLGDQR